MCDNFKVLHTASGKPEFDRKALLNYSGQPLTKTDKIDKTCWHKTISSHIVGCGYYLPPLSCIVPDYPMGAAWNKQIVGRLRHEQKDRPLDKKTMHAVEF